jgi:hypothetical protein
MNKKNGYISYSSSSKSSLDPYNYKSNSSKSSESNKPIYYEDYTVSENNNYSNKYNYIFFILLTIFVFISSIIDISYSYLNLDDCTKIKVLTDTTLDVWLRLNGIYGISCYFFMTIIIYTFYCNNYNEEKYNGYTLLSNKNIREKSEKYEICYKVFSTVLSIMMLILFSFGFYIFIILYNYCKSYSIIVYMWIRLISGTLMSIFLIIFINCK